MSDKPARDALADDLDELDGCSIEIRDTDRIPDDELPHLVMGADLDPDKITVYLEIGELDSKTVAALRRLADRAALEKDASG